MSVAPLKQSPLKGLTVELEDIRDAPSGSAFGLFGFYNSDEHTVFKVRAAASDIFTLYTAPNSRLVWVHLEIKNPKEVQKKTKVLFKKIDLPGVSVLTPSKKCPLQSEPLSDRNLYCEYVESFKKEYQSVEIINAYTQGNYIYLKIHHLFHMTEFKLEYTAFKISKSGKRQTKATIIAYEDHEPKGCSCLRISAREFLLRFPLLETNVLKISSANQKMSDGITTLNVSDYKFSKFLKIN